MYYFKKFLEPHHQNIHQKKIDPQECSGQFQLIQPQIEQQDNQDKIKQKIYQQQQQIKTQKQNQKHQSKSQQQDNQNNQNIENCQQFQKQQKNPKNLNDFLIIQIDQNQNQQQISLQQSQTSKKNNSTNKSTIKKDGCYIIIEKQQINQQFKTNQEWQQFYKKIKNLEQSQIVSLSTSKIKLQKPPISLNIKQLNSILQLKSIQIDRRIQFWTEIATPSTVLNFKHNQLCNKQDPEKLEKNVNKIIDKLATKILYEISQKKYREIQNISIELEKLKQVITKVLTIYGANDKQIGYSKGLEYVVLGIIIAKPFQSFSKKSNNQINQIEQNVKNYQQIMTHFKYLMFTKQLRNMYFPGTPKLYQQIQKLQKSMKIEISQLYQSLVNRNADFLKIFINYYKTFMLYKIKNPFVIRKLMQLLIICNFLFLQKFNLDGIDIVRLIIIRIMNKIEKQLLEIQDQAQLLKYLAQNLVLDYFQCNQETQILNKFKQLFIEDVFI